MTYDLGALCYVTKDNFRDVDPTTDTLYFDYGHPVTLASGWFYKAPDLFPKLKRVYISDKVFIDESPEFTASIQEFYYGDTSIRWLGNGVEVRGKEYFHNIYSLISVLHLARGFILHYAQTHFDVSDWPVILRDSDGRPVLKDVNTYNRMFQLLDMERSYSLFDESLIMGVAYLLDKGEISEYAYPIRSIFKTNPRIFEIYPRLVRLINDREFLAGLLNYQSDRLETKAAILNRLDELGGPLEIDFDLGEL